MDAPRCDCHGWKMTARHYRAVSGEIREYWYCPVRYEPQKARYRNSPQGRAAIRKWRLNYETKQRARHIHQIEEALNSTLQ